MLQSPPNTEKEGDRLKALLRYGILDTEEEGPYDDLAALAAYICDTPTALISLVDDKRQWFKARVGLETKETPRNIAFCAHAIMDDDVLIVPNAMQDARFANNQLVTDDPKIRFYAGAPLITSDGYALGTICVIDYKPRQPNPRQIEALKALSRQVVSQLELRLSHRKLSRMNEQKNSFIRLLSHDLRSSFGAVIGFARVANRRSHKMTPERTHDVFGKILNSATQGLSLLDNLLDWSVLQQDGEGLKQDDIVVAEVCEEVILYLGELARDKGIDLQLQCSSEGRLRVNRRLFRSVVQNLVHNAIKFSEKGRKVTVSFKQTETNSIFTVEDDGIGMTDDQIKNLLEDNIETTNGTSGEFGSGIGTRLVKEFATHYGCKLTVQRKTHGGTLISLAF